jgi:hypothetical protein
MVQLYLASNIIKIYLNSMRNTTAMIIFTLVFFVGKHILVYWAIRMSILNNEIKQQFMINNEIMVHDEIMIT